MKLFSYKAIKQKKETFLSMTSLTVEEFEELMIPFRQCWKEHAKEKGKVFDNMEDRLLFILYYLKTYPLQQVIAYCFEMSQGEANKQIHELSYILKLALNKGDFVPPRKSKEILEKLEQENPQDYVIDGTERRIIRPVDKEIQKVFHSGKKNDNTVKNIVLGGMDDRQIKGLTETCEGKKHDKKACDESDISLPKESHCYCDSGFQGLKIKDATIHIPKKKPRNGELTEEEKENNRLLASKRIVIEHINAGIKRCRIVKDVFRNMLANYEDVVMELACALHNFRTYHRRYAY